MRRVVVTPHIAPRSVGILPPTRLRDELVTLRVPDQTDVTTLARYGASPALLEGMWIAPPPTDDPVRWAEWRIAELRAGWTAAGSVEGAGLAIDAGQPFVGVVVLVPRAADVLELLYGIAPPARGRGIATRAVCLATDWVLQATRYRHVELRISEGHAASRRIAEKAGFALVERVETYVEATGCSYIDVRYVRSGGSTQQR